MPEDQRHRVTHYLGFGEWVAVMCVSASIAIGLTRIAEAIRVLAEALK